MNEQMEKVLEKATAQNGFLATGLGGDNYQRVWSRDSAITAIAIICAGKTHHFETIKNGIVSLLKAQSETGIIPSNIAASHQDQKPASFGSLVGRVDATTWWIIQSLIFIQETNDDDLKKRIAPGIRKALHVLQVWEFNERHLIYTPIGGNWADEYISNGYTLYDNLLRYWALKLVASVYPEWNVKPKLKAVEKAIHTNFNPGMKSSEFTVHPRLQHDMTNKVLGFWPSSFSPMGYDLRWDMAANALALLLGFNTVSIEPQLNDLKQAANQWMLPVFYPIIHPEDANWVYLAQNYNFQFKNFPNQFHNGGSWPVMLGLLCAGLAQTQQLDLCQQIHAHYNALLSAQDGGNFYEFYNFDSNTFGGMEAMCFSVAGKLFMEEASRSNSTLSKFI